MFWDPQAIPGKRRRRGEGQLAQPNGQNAALWGLLRCQSGNVIRSTCSVGTFRPGPGLAGGERNASRAYIHTSLFRCQATCADAVRRIRRDCRAKCGSFNQCVWKMVANQHQTGQRSPNDAPYIRTYVRTYVHTYIHTYIHTYTYTYIHACIHT